MKYFLVRNINMLYLDGNRTRQRDAKENMKFSITTQSLFETSSCNALSKI